MALEHVDVLIVGAGLSGIGAAVHLQKRCPGKTYTILESRDGIGGTWDLFRYPGIRSDSDMFTLGYAFKPWTEEKAIADGPAILKYVRETADEYGVTRNIQFGHKVVRAEWCSADARWTVEADRAGAPARFTCNFLYMCSGYYKYAEGYLPDFPGAEDFKGRVVHPQHWPQDLDYTDKKIVVIGSGATAVTIVPAMAAQARHVTMLQRSPTYMFSMPSEDALANSTRRMLPAKLAYGLTRWRKILLQMLTFNMARKQPEKTKARLVGHVRERLGPDYDVETHFTPRYNPWDQRLCLVPDDDMFAAIRAGKAAVVTDTIARFTETGVALASGQHLEADVIVAATGLALEVAGGIDIAIDGRPVSFADTFSYKGMMFSGVPNFASVFGYTNASWTLRADLVAEYVCRLINRMDRGGYAAATPVQDEPTLKSVPFLDFSSGYVQRAMAQFPKQGDRAPWRHPQNYIRDLVQLRFGKLEDGVMRFSKRPAARPVEAPKTLRRAA